MLNLITEEDVAARLHVSVAALRRWRLERRGPPFVKVGSLVRYRQEILEEWLASQPTGGSTSGDRNKRTVARQETKPARSA